MQWKQTNNLDFDEEILRGHSWGNSFQHRRIRAARNALECLDSDSEWNPYMFKMAAQLTDLLVSTAEVSNLFSILAVLGGLLVMMTFIIKMLYQVTPTCLSFLKLFSVQGSGWWGRSDQGDPSSPSNTNVQVSLKWSRFVLLLLLLTSIVPRVSVPITIAVEDAGERGTKIKMSSQVIPTMRKWKKMLWSGALYFTILLGSRGCHLPSCPSLSLALVPPGLCSFFAEVHQNLKLCVLFNFNFCTLSQGCFKRQPLWQWLHPTWPGEFYTVAGPLVNVSYLSGQPSGATPWRNGSCCLTPTRAQLGPKSQKFLSTGLFWGKALLGYYLYCVQVVVALRADLGGDVEDLAMVTSVLAVVHIKDNICPIPTQVRY